MATKISLINMKGGVGKTTLAVNLAWQFAANQAWGKRVLMVDLDPQFNASQYLLGVKRYKRLLDGGQASVWDVFEQGTRTPSGQFPTLEPADAVTRVSSFRDAGHVDLIPSRLEFAFSLKNPTGKETHLSRLVRALEPDYDLVLIDCAPTESVLTTAAYLCSDWIVVPVKPEFLSAIGLPLLANSMADHATVYPGNQPEIAGIAFNTASDYLPEEARAKEEVQLLAQQYGWHVFKEGVSYSRSYPKGARENTPIYATSHARWWMKANFRRFAAAVAKRVGL